MSQSGSLFRVPATTNARTIDLEEDILYGHTCSSKRPCSADVLSTFVNKLTVAETTRLSSAEMHHSFALGRNAGNHC